MFYAPILIQTDSYKAGHAQMYPVVEAMTAQHNPISAELKKKIDTILHE